MAGVASAAPEVLIGHVASATSGELFRVKLHQGQRGPVEPPEAAESYPYTPADLATVEQSRQMNVAGDPAGAWAELRRRAESAGADEVMVTTMVFDPAARLRSYELLAAAA